MTNEWPETLMKTWESPNGTLAIMRFRGNKYPSLYYKAKDGDNCYIAIGGPIRKPELLREFLSGKEVNNGKDK